MDINIIIGRIKMDYIERLRESINYIESKISEKPEIAIILGSGLGGLGDKIDNKTIIKYEDIPNFPESTVVGHAGQLVYGELANKKVIAMQGRFHFYEGYDIQDVVLPTRVMLGLGVKNLIVTNAAGGVDTGYVPGNLMLITDHINFTGVNPLIGRNYDELGPRFVDMSQVYDRELLNIARETAKDLKIDLKEGAYMWMTGPNYETATEVRMARALGASAVGMSTVPEVLVAAHQGVPVLGISCITNMAAGILDEALNHEEVIETSNMAREKFETLVTKVIEKL